MRLDVKNTSRCRNCASVDAGKSARIALQQSRRDNIRAVTSLAAKSRRCRPVDDELSADGAGEKSTSVKCARDVLQHLQLSVEQNTQIINVLVHCEES